MDRNFLRKLLKQIETGRLSVDAALERLRHFPSEDLGFAKVDHHRALRKGFPEVIFGQGKTAAQVARIARSLLDRNPNLLITRTDRGVFSKIKALEARARFHRECGSISVRRDRTLYGDRLLPVVSAGTADLAVAEEAAVTAEVMGNRVDRIYDVGVAGLHRLLQHSRRFSGGRVVIVVAGMEGALPSVVGGMVDTPVVAVPTSAGYGAALGGVAALLAMLNSCASNVTVVNIDNGFGAGYVASLINRQRQGSVKE
ncbi:MAG: nickel pincer cofactor biosynthesis protein LarB [Acidobacteria bacterium]|nr:nickel pincer cofactor biosynthesis protein LarB [Acidobacteriota bacterium]